MRLAPFRGRRKPEVQMSPLIDVIFLLLIFYAVTTQFVTDERLTPGRRSDGDVIS